MTALIPSPAVNHAARELGKFLTYHKCGAVSLRVMEFLRSADGRRQLLQAKQLRAKLYEVLQR